MKDNLYQIKHKFDDKTVLLNITDLQGSDNLIYTFSVNAFGYIKPNEIFVLMFGIDSKESFEEIEIYKEFIMKVKYFYNFSFKKKKNFI
jgi:hypothetical protein